MGLQACQQADKVWWHSQIAALLSLKGTSPCPGQAGKAFVKSRALEVAFIGCFACCLGAHVHDEIQLARWFVASNL